MIRLHGIVRFILANVAALVATMEVADLEGDTHAISMKTICLMSISAFFSKSNLETGRQSPKIGLSNGANRWATEDPTC